ncbi:MAG TPA: methylated-DNA--[protein]-cysteine S-methyltransferase [Solirubrobacteraceae bacterium]|nr:methylated-DNA--[protein]-cysteine S-methyltransferase [Solirubrobacteraceae bacterium]
MSPLSEQFLDRLASAAVREDLADAVYTTLPSPIGPLVVVQGRHGVVRIAFEGEPLDRTLARVAAGVGPRIVHSDRELAATREALSAYLEGDDDRLELPVDLSLVGGPFRRAVLETLHREVHRGEVVTYGSLARQAGNPRAVRAVGTACATNPIPIVVPCHRVLPASGRLGAYGGGPERKRRLLALEGASVRDA